MKDGMGPQWLVGFFYKELNTCYNLQKNTPAKGANSGLSKKSASQEIPGRLHRQIEGKCKDRDAAKLILAPCLNRTC
jgi:hypothetical protein